MFAEVDLADVGVGDDLGRSSFGEHPPVADDVGAIAVIEIQRIIGFLKERGIGVLITDHNVRETLGICDRAYIISDGRVLAEGTPAEIVANADVRKVYLGEHFRM